MFDYLNVGKRILKSLNNNGYEAYFVGESVRNSLLEKKINRVDITTNATIDAIKKMFNDCVIDEINEKLIKLYYNNYCYYVNSFYHITNNEAVPQNKHYSRNLTEDLFCRDFTINAIAMSHSGKISDPLNGHLDIKNKRIRHIGKAKKRFSQNPALMIKAFALMSEMNYKLAIKTKTEICKRRKKLLDYDIDLYIIYLRKVFEGPYARKAIRMMNQLNYDLVLQTFKNSLRFLESYKKPLTFEDVLLITFLLNGAIDDKYEKYITDYERFNKIYNVASQNKKSSYDDITLFNYGLDICLEANRINAILKRSRKRQRRIKKRWDSLKLKTPNDLMFNEVDLKRIIHPKYYFMIDDILIDASIAVLSGEIKNTFTDVQTVVINLLNQNNVQYKLNGFTTIEEEPEEILETKEEKKESDLDVINQYLNKTQISQMQNENQADDLVNIDFSSIENNNKIKELMMKDKNFEKEFKKFISNYIEEDKKEGDDE